MNGSAAQPLRILELRATYRDGGGPDKTILLSAACHDPSRFLVHCLYLRGASDHGFTLGNRARELGASFEEVLERHRIDPPALFALARAARRFAPDVIHTHDYKTDMIGWLLQPLLPNAALLATAHGWTLDNARMQLYNRLDRAVLRSFDRVIAVSEDTRSRLVASGVPASRLSVLYNGIDVERWSPAADPAPARAALRRELDLPAAARLLGFIGRLSPEKDVPCALEVARRVLEHESAAHVVMVGDGSFLEALPDRVAALRLAGRVHVVGHRRVTPELYHALDLYFMTSRTEGLPNTLLEAMSCGIPSVATAVGGIPELVADSRGAVLLPAGDAEGIARTILELLADPTAAGALARAGRRRIEAAFSFDVRLRRIEAHYTELASRSAGCGTFSRQAP